MRERQAGELGFEYNVVEGYWSRWSDAEVRELVSYSNERSVGLWFWRHSKELRTPEAREAFFFLQRKITQHYGYSEYETSAESLARLEAEREVSRAEYEREDARETWAWLHEDDNWLSIVCDTEAERESHMEHRFGSEWRSLLEPDYKEVAT